MTEKKFWRTLDKLSYQGVEGVEEAARVLRNAYENDLYLPCAYAHSRPDMVNQLFICKNGDDPSRRGNRYMLCYTSREMADSDKGLPEPWGGLPVRFVIDNALSKPTIGGLIFNRHVKDRILIIPKKLLGDRPKYFTELEWSLDKPISFPGRFG